MPRLKDCLLEGGIKVKKFLPKGDIRTNIYIAKDILVRPSEDASRLDVYVYGKTNSSEIYTLLSRCLNDELVE